MRAGVARRKLVRRAAGACVFLLVVLVSALVFATRHHLLPAPQTLPPGEASVSHAIFLDRRGVALSRTYGNEWNVHDRLPFHDFPPLLVDAFVAAEDKRFFEHGGVDWLARVHAMAQNVAAFEVVRGASTISEQVGRMVHPRRRTPWSRWLEGWEASRLEERFTKTEILVFYLNQVPYARNRRGVKQAARTYFDRDLDSLNPEETLALAVMVRSPSRLDLARGAEGVESRLGRLARTLASSGRLRDSEVAAIDGEPLEVTQAALQVDAAHFLRFTKSVVAQDPVPAMQEGRAQRITTLDASLQSRVQGLLESRLVALEARDATDGAVLVVDHRSDEILAWVNGFAASRRHGSQIDKITSPRQPGSTLKPFVYAMALERGWSAATRIDDSPLTDAVGHGMHSYRNYNRLFYGPISLREALGNSLNIPAVRATRFVGRRQLLDTLRAVGLRGLDRHSDYYGDGLVLGNGEVSLYELTSAYATLARGGVWRPLRWSLAGDSAEGVSSGRIFAPEVVSLIANILADPSARQLEFGHHSLLALPVQTAVKTGTSNDYRDAWAMGFSHAYTVGVWIGRVDGQPMQGVSGAIGPALVLRSVFAELHRHLRAEPLPLSRSLRRAEICISTGRLATPSCAIRSEWFRPGHLPNQYCRLHAPVAVAMTRGSRVTPTPKLISPTPGLHLAVDPRIPDHLEVFPLRIAPRPDVERVEWWVNDELVATTGPGVLRYLWPVRGGSHTVQAHVWPAGDAQAQLTSKVPFLVKGVKADAALRASSRDR